MDRAIVIGVDSSDMAPAVVDHGLRLAERLRLRPVIAHATTRRSEQVLERIDGRATAGELRVLSGDPVDALDELADELDAAVVVVGSRGRGPVRSALLGSVSRDLATRGSRPVLVVTHAAARRRAADGTAERSIVCGVDGSEHGDRAVQAAAALARAGDLRLVVAHVEGLPASPLPLPVAGVAAPAASHDELAERLRAESLRLLERAEQVVGAGGLEVDVRLEVGAASGVLASLGEEEDAAYIVVGSRGQGALRAAVLGSTSAQLVGASSRPVLLVSPEARAGLLAS